MAIINSPPTTAVDTQDVNDGTLRPPSEGWRSFFSAAWTICNSLTESGTAAQRPTSLLWAGRRYFDTTLGTGGEPIWRNKDNTGWVTLAGGGGGSGTVTSIGTTSPITGGPITTTGTIGINDAAADGVTKGAAAFVASDFNASAGVISIDYVNAQKATAAQPGFLTAADWVAFNAAASATPGHIIEDEGTPLTQRGTMNFTGAGVAVTDAGGKTVVTISGGGTVSLAVGTTAITSGTAGRVLFEGAGNVLSEDAGLTYDATTDALTTLLLTLGTVSSATGQLKLANASSANLTILQAGNAVAARTYTWPTDFGASGTVLTDAAGNGTLSWATASATVRLDQIAAGTADSTLTTTGTITMTSGVGAANTIGKTLAIQAGAGGATNAQGGPLNLTAGTGAGTGAGGALAMTGGTAGATGDGGAVTITGGTPVAGDGGAVSVSGAAGIGSSKNGGAVTIFAGASGSSGSPSGSAVTITGGGVNTGSNTGGAVNITGGTGGPTNGPGGAVTFKGGPGSGSGTGGTATVIGGNAGSTGNGGAVNITGGSPLSGGNGGAVNITGAAGIGTNKAGGDVVITAGAASGVGTAGVIKLIAPQVWANDGTNLAPAYSFANDTDCGLYRVNTNQIGLMAGTSRVTLSLTYLASSDVKVASADGTAALPNFTSNLRANDGMWLTSTTVGFANGGAEIMSLITGQSQFSKATADAVGFALNIRKSRGTVNSPTVITTGDDIGVISGYAYVGSTNLFRQAATITFDSTGTISDATTGVGGVIRFGTMLQGTDTAAQEVGRFEQTGAFATKNKIYPGTDGKAFQSAAGIYAGTGAPNNANGADGDFYFRSDGGAGTAIYQRRSGSWVGLI